MAERSAYSAKPSSVAAPVPGKEEKLTADALLAELETPPIPSSAQGALTAESLLNEDVAAAPAQEQSVGGQVLDAAGRVLDYPGGFARAGLASAASTLSGQDNVVKPEDLKAALKGKGPDSAEYLRRLGVGEGGSFNVPGLGKVTQRGAAGLALDIATDPLTAISKLAKAAPYLKKALGAPGKVMEAAGEALYRSGLSKIDDKLAARGEDALSSLLIKEGAPVGTQAQIAQKASAMAETMGKLRQGLYDKINQAGVAIDTSQPFKKAEAVLAGMRRDPTLHAAADTLQEMLNQYKSAGKVGVDVMSEWKTNLYESLPASAFDGFGKLKGRAKEFKGALASDFREAIIEAGNKADKGLGDAINALNEKWGTLLSAQKPLAGASGGVMDKLGASIDGILLGSGHGWALAGKKALDLGNTTAAKTAAGRVLMELGKKDLTNKLTRQAVIKSTREEK